MVEPECVCRAVGALTVVKEQANGVSQRRRGDIVKRRSGGGGGGHRYLVIVGSHNSRPHRAEHTCHYARYAHQSSPTFAVHISVWPCLSANFIGLSVRSGWSGQPAGRGVAGAAGAAAATGAGAVALTGRQPRFLSTSAAAARLVSVNVTDQVKPSGS